MISALNFVENGLYAGVIVQDGFDMGYQAVKFLKEYKEGTQTKEIFTDVTCITKENVEQYRAQRETIKENRIPIKFRIRMEYGFCCIKN